MRRIEPVNYLLVLIPIAFGLRFAGADGVWIFLASSVAIIPVAALMGKSTEALANTLGEGLGGLLNATFGNAAELIIAIIALKAGLIDVVKASITGSILGNILLVLGLSFFAGGTRYSRQQFNSTAAGMSATLLALSAIALVIPAVFHSHLVLHHTTADERGVSLEIAIVLFCVYLCLLWFSLRTHKHLYAGGGHEAPPEHGGAEGAEAGHWSVGLATGVLIGATVVIALLSELLVGAIEEARQTLGMSEIFVGVIVVAIVGNAAEHSTAVVVALKNRMELSFQIAVGSALQIALFVAPALVFISYLPGFQPPPGHPPFDLNFSMLEIVAVLVSVLVVGMVAFDGESNWFEGLLLLAVYVILGIAFFNLPLEHQPAGAKKAASSEPAPTFLPFTLPAPCSTLHELKT